MTLTSSVASHELCRPTAIDFQRHVAQFGVPPLTFGLVCLLAMMGAGMAIFSDMIIAALPGLQKAFAASDRDTQQIVSLFFLATALCL